MSILGLFIKNTYINMSIFFADKKTTAIAMVLLVS